MGQHIIEYVYEVIQPPEVAILPVALHPGSPVVQCERGRQGDSLPEVDHPHPGLSRGVVYKEQRTTHDLGQEQARSVSLGVFTNYAIQFQLDQQVCQAKN